MRPTNLRPYSTLGVPQREFIGLVYHEGPILQADVSKEHLGWVEQLIRLGLVEEVWPTYVHIDDDGVEFIRAGVDSYDLTDDGRAVARYLGLHRWEASPDEVSR